MRQWNKFENRSIFDEVKAYEVKAYKSVPVFGGGAPVHTDRELCNSYKKTLNANNLVR